MFMSEIFLPAYCLKQIKDILRREEEQAIEEYIKENEAKKEEH